MTAKAILFINIQMNKNLFHICLIGIIFIMMVGCKRASTSEKFAQKAVLENKTYPQKINDSIIIDSTRFDVATNTLRYFYTVSKGLDNEQLLKTYHSEIWNGLKAELENSVQMKPYLDAHCNIHYVYYSESTRKKIAEFVFK